MAGKSSQWVKDAYKRGARKPEEISRGTLVSIDFLRLNPFLQTYDHRFQKWDALMWIKAGTKPNNSERTSRIHPFWLRKPFQPRKMYARSPFIIIEFSSCLKRISLLRLYFEPAYYWYVTFLRTLTVWSLMDSYCMEIHFVNTWLISCWLLEYYVIYVAWILCNTELFHLASG